MEFIVFESREKITEVQKREKLSHGKQKVAHKMKLISWLKCRIINVRLNPNFVFLSFSANCKSFGVVACRFFCHCHYCCYCYCEWDNIRKWHNESNRVSAVWKQSEKLICAKLLWKAQQIESQNCDLLFWVCIMASAFFILCIWARYCSLCKPQFSMPCKGAASIG